MKISDIPLKGRKGTREISLRIQTDISYIKRGQRYNVNLSLNRTIDKKIHSLFYKCRMIILVLFLLPFLPSFCEFNISIKQ